MNIYQNGKNEDAIDGLGSAAGHEMVMSARATISNAPC
jgi:hypothetical protein